MIFGTLKIGMQLVNVDEGLRMASLVVPLMVADLLYLMLLIEMLNI